MWFDIVELVQLAIILLISIGMHEYAHAFVSHKLGDPTPQLQWRLTPNPIKHLDPIWFLMIFIIHFGRWKPVQINPSYYKKPIQWEFFVAMAGPATNIFLAILGIFILLIYSRFSGFALTHVLLDTGNIVIAFWKLFAFINIALAIFNLLPIPPLDWFSIIKIIRPQVAGRVRRHQTYVIIAFLIIVLGPWRGIIGNFIMTVATQIFEIIFQFFSYVIY